MDTDKKAEAKDKAGMKCRRNIAGYILKAHIRNTVIKN